MINKYVPTQIQDFWHEWIPKIPYIQFPADWKIKVVPPFGGALIRCYVKTPDWDLVSVYLDVDRSLGACEEPYWEVYPADCLGGVDVERCGMDDIEELLRLIDKQGKEAAALAKAKIEVPEGWQLVPKKWTQQMRRALFASIADETCSWEAILAVAPTYEGEKE